jgi:PAS domain S-box-containing protein
MRSTDASGRVRGLAAASLVLFVAVGVGLAAIMAGIIRHREENVAAFHAQFVVEAVLAPELQSTDLASPVTGHRYEELAKLVRERILSDGRDVRVKIWRPDGTIVFSDFEPLVGRAFPEERGELQEVLRGNVQSGVSDLADAENVAERGIADKLFQTYVPLRLSPGGPVVGVAEVYQDYSKVEAEVERQFRTLALAFGAGLTALYALLFPMARRPLRKQNERLRQAETRYRTLIEQIPAVTFIDEVRARRPEGVVPAYMSPQAEQMFGYPIEDWMSSHDLWREILHPNDRDWVSDAGKLALERGEAFQAEYRVIARDGRVVWIQERSVSVKDDAGRPEFWQGVMFDITEMKQMEAELREGLERLRATDDQRRRLLSALVAAQEEERQRIAADIHDDPIQKMTAVGIRLETIMAFLQVPEQNDLFEKLQESVSLAIEGMRDLLFDLNPRSLTRDGLAVALREYLGQVADEIGEWHLLDQLTAQPEVETRTIIYRIALEALTNVRKHAKARRVDVLLETRESGVLVRIRDDGIGFVSTDEPPLRGHIGLPAMRERAELAGGWLRVDSELGRGSTVEFWIPRVIEPNREPLAEDIVSTHVGHVP